MKQILLFTILLSAASPIWAQLPNYPVDDDRRLGTPEKPPQELQFIGFFFTRLTASNIAPENEFLRGQIIGRLFGPNSTTTVPQTAFYGEGRFVPLFVYRPSLLDGIAIFRGLFKVDVTWGDVNYGVGNNVGGAINAGTVNIQTLMANLELRFNQSWNVVIGVQRIFDNPRDPNVNTLQTNQTSANRLMFWGTQGVGISSYFNLSPVTTGRLGYYQLYENFIQIDDDVVLLMADAETRIGGLWELGGSAWYLYDRGQGEGGVSILGQGFNSLLVDYNGGARFQLGQNRYKGDVIWAGANVSYNREFIGGRVWASAMTMFNVGNLNVFTPQGADAGNVGIFGVTAHASFNYKYGQTNNDRVSIEALYTSGDANNVSDGQYTGVVTGNTWGSPVGIFSSHRAFLLFPDVQVVNRYYSAVHDISNMGFGTTAVFFNYFNNIVPNKVLIKLGAAAALANQPPSGAGQFIGAELNAELKYSLALFLDLGVSAAYMINGDFYDSPLTRPTDLGTRPKNPWAVFSTISWLMF
ncbi:MAG: hypothetical protein HY22_10715 [[Candidatus Thermochlorobacteriaceae] bacterium GBChlB]|nr:MAG: hypothetical protein HY22_10715 [[Candidatus Thermochlorobacteriaceae] bacterium GBChlB]